MNGKKFISKKSLKELREYFVSTTLGEIEKEFDAADINPDLDFSPNVSGQRRTLVEQYYKQLDFSAWADAKRMLSVYENVLCDLEHKSKFPPFGRNDNWYKDLFIKLKKFIERDGYLYKDGVLIPTSDNRTLCSYTDIIKGFDFHELQKQIERARNAVEDDPGLAIGTAKEIIETTCKTILRERKIEIPSAWGINELVKATRKELKLLPDNISEKARGKKSISKLLNNLSTISTGLAELRNLYGTGHGRDGKAQGLQPRHARLAVGASSTLATFLFETHQERIDR